MTRLQTSARRRGFTLIELLVVIAIIAVLISLTTAAVMRFLIKGPEITCRSDIDGLSASRGAFLAEFGVNHVPSQIKLCETANGYNMANRLDADSVNFLNQIFGKRFNANAGGFDWNGNGNATDAAVTLSGDQCLVFFLGGIPSNSGTTKGCRGFSTSPTSPTNPTDFTGGGAPRGPFFEFKSNRLVVGTGGFFNYTDAFGKKPYAYFSAGKVDNGYNRYGTSDCATLGVSPYFQSTSASGTIFYNPRGFQIISAGADGNFGPGGLVDPAVGATDAPSKDNFTNFSRLRLGAPIQ